MTVLRLFFCSIWLVFAVLCQTLTAQLTSAFISGVVQDPSAAVMRAVRITITNKATNQEREAVTNDVGVYRFVGVQPGDYDIVFSAPNFESATLGNVAVGPAKEVVLNRTMAIAYTQASIEVRDEIPVSGLAKATPTIEQAFGANVAQALPLTSATRDVTRLALRAPMVARAPGSSELSANGQRARQNNFLLDGTDNNDLTVTGPTIRIIPEAVSEFQVQATAYSAEFGRNTGAQVSILTRAGTNVFHGQAWDYFRANWMEPVNLLNKRAGLRETPRFVQNQVGASLGGPLRKGRTFFFGLGEANRRRESPDARNAQSATIPTPAGYAALSTVPLGPNQTNESRGSVLKALSFLQDVYRETRPLEPAAPQLINGVSIEMGTTRIPLANRQDLASGLVRFDHRLSDSDLFSYRFLLDKRSQPDSTGNRQFGNRFAVSAESFSQNHSFGFTYVPATKWVNEFRFAYSRTDADFLDNDPTDPTVQIANAFTFGGASNFPQGKNSSTYQWQDVFTYLLGRHSFKIGVDLRQNRLFNRTTFDAKGTWLFQNLSDFLNNRAFSLRQSLTDPTFDAGQTNQFYFIQDDVKVSRELTLSLGLRYEFSGAPFGFFGAASSEIAAAGVPLPARSDRNNFAPRFGFAYSPDPKAGWQRRVFGPQQTVFRGGFGMGYDVIFYNVLTLTAMNYPRVQMSAIFQPQTIGLFPTLAPKLTTVSTAFDPTIAFVNTPADIQNPTIHFWSFSIQRQIRRNLLLEIGYSGNRSYHLLRLDERNPGILTADQAKQVRDSGSASAAPSLQQRRLNPSWGSRASIESTALSRYNAAFARFEQRFSPGLLIGANYTWSANLSDNDEPLAIGDIVLSSPHAPQNFFNYRNEWSRSVFDRPQRLSIHYLFDFPGFGGKNSLIRYVASGWQIGGFSEWQSGQPFTVRTGVDSGGSGFAIGWRPDYNSTGRISRDPDLGNLRTFAIPDGDVFLTPLTGKLPLANSMPQGGNLGRNTFRGPGFANWDLSVLKRIPISEQLSIQLRADLFNTWNHRNFGNPVATMNSSAFGTNTTDPGGRTMLLALKLSF